jgi:glycosyltransferase involved in cell wall biosynthesis
VSEYDTLHKELADLQKRNEDLEAELQQLHKEIAKHQEIHDKLSKKKERMEEELLSAKQSFVWQTARQAIRTAKTTSKYLTGKKSLKELINPSIKQKQAKKRLKKYKYALYELGFEQRAYEDIQRIMEKTDNIFLKRLAAFELALWHANKYTKEDALKCLQLLSIAIQGEENPTTLRRSAILASECHDILGNQEKGVEIILKALANEWHGDLFLAMSNLVSSPNERISWMNKAMDFYHIPKLKLAPTDTSTLYDSIDVADSLHPKMDEQYKVTVIIPCYNAEKSIHTSIKSMLSQTWTNLEIIVADDCSTDNTREVVREYMKQDSRIKLVQAETNGGAYIARNLALKEATGDFVTINDADDWSHPEKIATQILYMINHPEVIANTSEQARATEDLKFYRRGKPGEYIFANMSSLMFRRKEVMEKIGFWDCVRFGADGEFKRRLKLVFGDKAVVDLKTGPLSFQRQAASSLTGNQTFGFHGFFMGARKEYFESYSFYHRHTKDFYYPFPQEKRLFPVPEPMWPKREEKKEGRRHFDVIIASEFRLLGGTNMSNIEEIKAQKQYGLRTGLIQMNRYDFYSEKELNPKVRELIDGDMVQMIVYGEKVTCDVLIIRHPPVLQDWQKYIPDVDAKAIRVIINQPPKRDYSKAGKTLYDLKTCAKHIQQYFGRVGKWYPIGPLVREVLHEHHKKELPYINLASQDWVNIINIDEWKRKKRPRRGSTIKIGRHSRGQYVKWPNNKEQMLQIYPDDKEFEIHVLGGAEAPKQILGELPANWHVLEFGEMDPKAFLADLDIFVYFTHPDWVEAFGRVMIEAMAVGVPVIIPPTYQSLFGEAAIYAKPNEVKDAIHQLMNNDEYYEEQVQKAQNYVEKHFGYSMHLARINELKTETHDYQIR